MAAPVSISRILLVLRAMAESLIELQQQWALIGGLAVSIRAEPRFTRDVDIAVAVHDDEGAESLVHRLGQRGYQVITALEHKTGRLATVRLRSEEESLRDVIVDLLFASSGIEREIVADAEAIAILPDLAAPVARLGHLVALKVLADGPGRRHDSADLDYLLRDISPIELARARDAITLIEQRGYNRGKALNAVLDDLLSA